MPGYGPNNFVVPTSDQYEINNPGDDKDVHGVTVEIPVTVNWDFPRLKAEGVTLGEPVWLGAGRGPHPVFDDTGAIAYPRGLVSWDVGSRWYAAVETGTDRKKFRYVYVIEIKLLRTFTPKDGNGGTGTPRTVVATTNVQRDVGGWQAMP
ncbi:MAG: hypothetical protein HYV75_08365 [Opitutae bacterium]|nr:hypothetical protein [Opitutae bacterium]